jgi:hypothetical protein
MHVAETPSVPELGPEPLEELVELPVPPELPPEEELLKLPPLLLLPFELLPLLLPQPSSAKGRATSTMPMADARIRRRIETHLP